MRKELADVIASIHASAAVGNRLLWVDVEDMAFDAMAALMIDPTRRDSLWDAARDRAGSDPEYDDVIHELDAVINATRV